ncbi:unnamed protein product [Arabis nemorensis]|uniref:Uncharacterized protein n=1 Tax=Arabis nemorensis TaxID=586526 RepID=A0A565ATN1_9BRAS|nr:unnamed protein product [Arabis nemorensis]
MLYYLTAVVFGMVGLTYAAVPLYRTFCQATGYGGTIQRKETVEEKIARHSESGTVTEREIVVQFNADVADGMQWKFTPTPREVRVKPGESALAFYTAENKLKFVSHNRSLDIQCHSHEGRSLFQQDTVFLLRGAATSSRRANPHAGLLQNIDPAFETDPRMDGINNLILCLTLSLKCPRKLVQIRTTITALS